MFWSDDKEKKPAFVVPDDVVDLAFRFSCPMLPLDHAHALSSELLAVLPWLEDEEHAGVHLIHGAASGNGWYRPEDAANEILHLSRRSRMRLRVPQHRLEEARALTGKTLNVAGHEIEVGECDVFMLSSLSTLFARYVVTNSVDDEEAFLAEAAAQLQAIDIPCRKMLGGIKHTMEFPDGPVHTRSLMVAELEPDQSVRLQQMGLGPGRSFGCGLFLPHKGIKAVSGSDDE
jgi:CRISPR-associated protein Cas6